MTIGEPFEVESGDAEEADVSPAVCGRAAFVDDIDRPVRIDGYVAVAADSRFERLRDRPRFTFVIAEPDGYVLALEIARGVGRVARFAAVGVDEQDAVLLVLGLLRQTDHAAHADGLDQLLVKNGRRPACCAVAAVGDRAAVLR